MDCRRCGVCCTHVSISSHIPGQGPKPAGMRCIHLGDDHLCRLFGDPTRPKVCGDFQSHPETCGNNRLEAVLLQTRLESTTK